jgi:hypothetical protein
MTRPRTHARTSIRAGCQTVCTDIPRPSEPRKTARRNAIICTNLPTHNASKHLTPTHIRTHTHTHRHGGARARARTQMDRTCRRRYRTGFHPRRCKLTAAIVPENICPMRLQDMYMKNRVHAPAKEYVHMRPCLRAQEGHTPFNVRSRIHSRDACMCTCMCMGMSHARTRSHARARTCVCRK